MPCSPLIRPFGPPSPRGEKGICRNVSIPSSPLGEKVPGRADEGAGEAGLPLRLTRPLLPHSCARHRNPATARRRGE
ncbi:hypothetical protein E0H70_33830 [Rhizobium leguminosarum bv. viciae]|nr:hypothetical protein E0H70_33830 [Rhizobium leguminosarum bv. viciae]